MTLQQLKYVIAVADHHSMSKAAQSLFISQPSLSNAIKELEQEVGIHIFLRNNKGISVTEEGWEFLGYARQVIEQAGLLELRYTGGHMLKKKFSVSTQHYSFAVNAFVDLVKQYGMDDYEFSIRETMTYKIIDDVRSMRSELGVLYINSYNEKILSRQLSENCLSFHELFKAKPHVSVYRNNPLAQKKSISLIELADYPNLVFEQGDYNSFYYAEELLSLPEHRQTIRVTDRATMVNLAIGLNGFTVSTGIFNEELNGNDIVTVPLEAEELIRVGTITNQSMVLSTIAQTYMDNLKKYTSP